MVNFMCQLDWAKGRPVSWYDIISGCYLRMFPEETGIRIRRLSKADQLSPMWAGISHLGQPEEEKEKVEDR